MNLLLPLVKIREFIVHCSNNNNIIPTEQPLFFITTRSKLILKDNIIQANSYCFWGMSVDKEGGGGGGSGETHALNFCSFKITKMGPLQATVTWYKLHHAWMQASHWDIQNKENSKLTG